MKRTKTEQFSSERVRNRNCAENGLRQAQPICRKDNGQCSLKSTVPGDVLQKQKREGVVKLV